MSLTMTSHQSLKQNIDLFTVHFYIILMIFKTYCLSFFIIFIILNLNSPLKILFMQKVWRLITSRSGDQQLTARDYVRSQSIKELGQGFKLKKCFSCLFFYVFQLSCVNVWMYEVQFRLLADLTPPPFFLL